MMEGNEVIKRTILMLVLMISTGAQAFETPEITLNPTVGPVACPYTTFSTSSLSFPDRPIESTVNKETHHLRERGHRECGWKPGVRRTGA